MDHSIKAVDPSLLKQPGDEIFFDTMYEYPMGAGNFTSKAAAQAIVPDLQELAFRITVDAGWATVWVNGTQYRALKKAAKTAEDKQDMKKALKYAPHLAVCILVLAVALGALGAWHTWVAGAIYGFENASPWLGFAINAGVTLVVGAITFVFYLVNRGRSF